MKRRNLNVRLYLMYLIALLPLIVFGAYKNGISLYRKDLVTVVGAIRPIMLLLCALISSCLGAIIRERRRGVPFDKTMLDNLKGDIVEAVLIASILPISSNFLVIAVVNFVFSLLLRSLKFNRVAIMYIFIEGTNVLMGLNEFRNVYELSTVLNYDGVDFFFGSGPGGIFSTNVFLIAIGLILLSFNKLYKKETVYPALLTFLILGVSSKVFIGSYDEIFPYIFGYNFLFVIIFVAPNLYSSSYTIKGQITSGILIGILTFVLSFWTPYTASILAVIITSVSKEILDKIFVIR